ncbi:MAG: sensor histidine kinase, partial [Chloroflexota bacterium]
PGAILAALALANEGQGYYRTGVTAVGRSYRRAGWAFGASAGLSGLIVPSSDFFPASVLNYSAVASLTGLPVAAFRAALALIIAYFVLSAVRGIDDERRRKLELANAQLQRLALQVLSAQEEERKRIARELHDETVQVLSLLLVRLKLLRREGDREARDRQLEDATQLALQAADGLRRIARDLRPPAIDDLGLVSALAWYASAFKETHGLAVDFSADGLSERPTPEVELALYRIAQEALSNVAKHARARKVWVQLLRTADSLTALVEDDGCGFDVNAVRASRKVGMGLFGMEERASVLGARLIIDSRPGAGTKVRVDVPLGVAYG